MKVFWMTGGIGNQLFIYSAAKKIELETGHKVYFDLSNYKFDFRELKLTVLGIQVNEVRWFQFLPFRPKIKNIIEQCKFLSKFKSTVVIDDNTVIPQSIKYQYYKGYWHSTNFYLPVVDLIKKEINLIDNLKTSVFLEWEEKITSCYSVSIHVRRTDYLSDLNFKTYVELDANYYNYCIQRILDFKADAEFFIFSDDEVWVRENLFTDRLNMHFVSGKMNNDCSEFELARTCRSNIIANSTYSWWIATLNKNSESIVYAPKNYYKIEELNQLYNSEKILFNPRFRYV